MDLEKLRLRGEVVEEGDELLEVGMSPWLGSGLWLEV